MYIDLDSLSSPSHIARNQTREVVKKSERHGYMSILHAVPVQSRAKVQKSMSVRKATNKPKQAFKPTPESAAGSTIGNTGRPNATSNLSGAPKATAKPSGIEAILASVIEALTAAVKVSNPAPRDTTPQALASTIAEDRRREEADEWNARRSAAQRASFTFHAAKGDYPMVSLGKSAHSVRMQGNRFAPAPSLAKKSEATPRFNDTYMKRRG